MPRRRLKAGLVPIIPPTLITPRVDGIRNVRVPLGQVLAGAAVRVGECAFRGPGRGVRGERGVPGDGARVVVRAVGVGAVEDRGGEGAGGGVLG